MTDIAPLMSIIDPHLPAKDSLSVRLHADSDTFYPLSETPAAALTPSTYAFSVLIFLRHLAHSLQPSSKLFVSPPHSPSFLRFVDVHALRPSSVCISDTAFLYFIVELLPKIGTQSEMERKRKWKTEINTTINHGRRATRAQTNAVSVMGTGTDGDEEENKITMNHLQQEWYFGWRKN